MPDFQQLEMNFVPTLYTLGAEGRSAAELREILSENDIRVVLDIRRTPDATSNRELRRDGMSSLCKSIGIRYQWEISLIDTSRSPREIDLTNEQSGLRTLNSLFSKTSGVCLFCEERSAENCHRSYIASRLGSAREIQVIDL